MNNFTFKDNLLWRSLLIRSALVVVTVAIVVWAMPHDTANTFPVEEGKPWRYAELTAPFDFPVLKSDAAIRHERDSVLRNYEPYYNYDGTTETRMVRKPTAFPVCPSAIPVSLPTVCTASTNRASCPRKSTRHCAATRRA